MDHKQHGRRTATGTHGTARTGTQSLHHTASGTRPCCPRELAMMHAGPRALAPTRPPMPPAIHTGSHAHRATAVPPGRAAGAPTLAAAWQKLTHVVMPSNPSSHVSGAVLASLPLRPSAEGALTTATLLVLLLITNRTRTNRRRLGQRRADRDGRRDLNRREICWSGGGVHSGESSACDLVGAAG